MQVHPPQKVPDRFVSRPSARVRSVGAKAKSVENFYSRGNFVKLLNPPDSDTEILAPLTPNYTLFLYYEGRDTNVQIYKPHVQRCDDGIHVLNK